jgi:hypothetical protein
VDLFAPPIFCGPKRGGAEVFVEVEVEVKPVPFSTGCASWDNRLYGPSKDPKFSVDHLVSVAVEGLQVHAVVTSRKMRIFKLKMRWHYRLRDPENKIDIKHWYPESLVYDEESKLVVSQDVEVSAGITQ